MEQKKRTLIIVVLVSLVILCIVSVGISQYVKHNQNNDMHLVSPTVILNVSKEEDRYTARVTDIKTAPDINKWLKVEDISYLLFPKPLPKYGDDCFPLPLEGGTTEEYFRALMSNESNPFNMASGKLTDIINSTYNSTNGNVTYCDNDADEKVSINDTILINSTLIQSNSAYEEFGLDLIYMGDLEGSLSEEIFDFIGHVNIDGLQ